MILIFLIEIFTISLFQIKNTMETITFNEALKLPKGGAVEMNKLNIQAQAADTIKPYLGIKGEVIFNWGNKYNVDLAGYGYLLTHKKNYDIVFEEIVFDKFDKVKMLIIKS